MSANSTIRAGAPAYPAGMRRLFPVVLVITVAAVVVYRNRAIDRCERELGIGRHATGAQPADRPAR